MNSKIASRMRSISETKVFENRISKKLGKKHFLNKQIKKCNINLLVNSILSGAKIIL